jgi:hypothetical protein
MVSERTIKEIVSSGCISEQEIDGFLNVIKQITLS